MSQFPVPRGTARAIRRGNVAPSLGFVPFNDLIDEDDVAALDDDWERSYQAELLARYRDLRDEGYTHYQAMLMSGRGDPDSLGCT